MGDIKSDRRRGFKRPLVEYYCDKLGTKILFCGSCEEVKKILKPTRSRPRKLNKYERMRKYKRKMERIANACGHRYLCGAYRVGYDGRWTDDPDQTKYIKRYYRANHTPGHSGFLKKQSSRRFRRYKDELANGCAYKKTFDYWWELT